MSVGPLELSVVVGLALLIFGPRQLPKLGRALGETLREVRHVGHALADPPRRTAQEDDEEEEDR
jgi:sec-independent protein translocase protein TatA